MKNERGAAMIVVLIVLLLIAIAGTIALRTGLFGMRLSTNSQVNKLLKQGNDTAEVKFQDMSPLEIQANFALGGIYNYLLEPANASDELVFCYETDAANTYDFTRAARIKNGNLLNPGNFCDQNTFSSSRNAVITQVHMRRNPAPSSTPTGRTLSQSGLPSPQANISLAIAVVSVMPAYTDGVDTAAIGACFRESAFDIAGTGNSVGTCLTNLNVPHEVQSIDYESGNNLAWNSP